MQKYYLDQFFDIWGVVFSSTAIGGYSADATNALTVYVNGTPHNGDPRELELTEREEIVIVFGTPSEVPSPIPSTYAFPLGY